MVYIYNGILFNIKKREILTFMTTWVKLEGIMLSEIRQTEKDKYFMVSLICGIKKKVKLIDTESRKVVVRSVGNRERLIKGTDFQL